MERSTTFRNHRRCIVDLSLHRFARTILSLILVIITFSVGYTQTFEEFKQQRQAALDAFREENSEQLRKMQLEYDAWVKRQDQEFRKHLEQRWREFDVFRSMSTPIGSPKPTSLPDFSSSGVDAETSAILPKGTASRFPGLQDSAIYLPEPPIRSSGKPLIAPLKFSFEFYRRELEVLTDSSMIIPSHPRLSEKAIAEYWDFASKANYVPLVENLLVQREEMGLNDYGYYLLLRKFSSVVYPGHGNSAALLTWYLMTRSGYEVKIGRQDSTLLVLLPSRNYLYGKDYITWNGLRYWVLEKTSSEVISTYDKFYTPGGSLVRFDIPRPISISRQALIKPVSIRIGNYPVNLSLKYDPGVIDFFREYPVVDLDVYFNASLSRFTRESLVEGLRTVVVGMNQLEAVNFLLNFVQSAFRYETDQVQFGEEKPMFCEETIFYPSSDCEDRSVMYAHLVREILGIDVIGLVFSSHMATALMLEENVEGNYIKLDGARYTIADPTYMGAPAGRLLPAFLNEHPTDIITSAQSGQWMELAEEIWNAANAIGIHAASAEQNLLAVSAHGFVLTGYTEQEIGEAIDILPIQGARRIAVMAMFDREAKLVWSQAIPASESSCGIEINWDGSSVLYMAGIYSGKIHHADDGSIIEADEGVFIAALDMGGKVLWVSRAPFDSTLGASSYPFLFSCNANGSDPKLIIRPYYEDFNQYGFSRSSQGRLMFSGISSAKTGFVAEAPAILEQQAHFDLAELLKRVNDEFIRENTDPGIAGIFAATEIVRDHRLEIKGADIQRTLDKHNTGFKTRNRELYQALGEIVFVKNNKGVINIRTKDGNRVLIYKMKIRDNSSLSITPMKNGDLLIEVLEGIQVGEGLKWANLIRIRLLKRSGDMVFDYHVFYKATSDREIYNIRKDVLH